MKLLVREGIKADLNDNDGGTRLSWAAQNGFDNVGRFYRLNMVLVLA